MSKRPKMKKRDAEPDDNDPDEYAEYEPPAKKGKKTKLKKTYGAAGDSNKAYGDSWDS